MKCHRFLRRGILVLVPFALVFFTPSAPAVPVTFSFDSSGAGGGAIRIGASTTTCDASAEGALRANLTTHKLEACNGTSWSAISL